PGDQQQALYWYEKAAEAGVAAAQLNLAVKLDEGEVVARDQRLAAHWYEQAAVNGEAQAANNLGVLYAMGEGVARNDSQAYIWFDIAARLGNPKASRHRERVARELKPEQRLAAARASEDWIQKHQG
ncbi:MAG: sel1 repeat family protein, partial [Gammaproteobacteria bacterium]|nr:sel1 repeat family protein [Gammaproteobacteria bacterium]